MILTTSKLKICVRATILFFIFFLVSRIIISKKNQKLSNVNYGEIFENLACMSQSQSHLEKGQGQEQIAVKLRYLDMKYMNTLFLNLEQYQRPNIFGNNTITNFAISLYNKLIAIY